MNTVTITPTTATAELNDTIVALEGLHAGFETILQQAVSQLDELELNEEQLEKIARRVCWNRTLARNVADEVNHNVMEDLKNEDEESAVIRYLENRLTTVVWSRIERKINDEINRQVNNLDLGSVISYHLRRHDSFKKTLRENELMSDMVNVIAHKILELKPESEND